TPEKAAQIMIAPAPALRWRPLLLAGVGAFVLAMFGIWLSRLPGDASALWLANAFGLGLVLQRPDRDARGLLAVMCGAHVAANCSGGDSVGVSVLLSAANLIEIGCSAALLRVMTARMSTAQPGPLATFALTLGIAASIGPAVGAIAGASVLSYFYG